MAKRARVWDGSQYVDVVGPQGPQGPLAVVVSPTQPSNPVDGLVWIDSDAEVTPGVKVSYAATPPLSAGTGDVVILSADYTVNTTVSLTNDSNNRYGGAFFAGTDYSNIPINWTNPHTSGKCLVTASTTWGGAQPGGQYIVDRAANETYLAGNNQWIKFDFGAGYSITPVGYALRQRNTGYGVHAKTIQFAGSNNNSDWTDIGSTNQMTNTMDTWTDVTLTNTTAYRYVRWTCIDSWSGDAYFTLGELEVFGDFTGSVTYPARTMLVYDGADWVNVL